MALTRYLLVALGGALGSVGRYWVGGLAPRLFGYAFPTSTTYSASVMDSNKKCVYVAAVQKPQ